MHLPYIILGLILFLFGFGILSIILSIVFDHKSPRIIQKKLLDFQYPKNYYNHESPEESVGVIIDDDDS